MKIELKKIKFAAFASHETSCFDAEIWIDGKKAGEVSNDGHGGCNDYHPHGVEAVIDAYASTLPAIQCEFNDDDGKPHMMEQDAELLIGNLLDDWLVRKDFNRLIKSRLVWIKTDDGKMYSGKKQDADTMRRLLADPAGTTARIKNCKTLLNILPVEEAIALFKQHTSL